MSSARLRAIVISHVLSGGPAVVLLQTVEVHVFEDRDVRVAMRLRVEIGQIATRDRIDETRILRDEIVPGIDRARGDLPG
jgi:hypothetical protein